MFSATITPGSSTSCTCIDGTSVSCTGGSCASVTNPYTHAADSRILTYVTVTATQTYSAPAPWGTLAPASKTLSAGTVTRIQ